MPEVPHQLAYGGDAEYDPETQCIWVDQSLAAKASKSDETSQWLLMLALIQAWGRHIDHQLRHVWSDVGGQSEVASGSVYALTLLPLDKPVETHYASVQSPEASGTLVVKHQTPQRLVKKAGQAYQHGAADPIERGVRLRCEGGQQCPLEGWWFAPAAEGGRYFKVGEMMPILGGDYGLTIWQIDSPPAGMS
jgi:hypothetical protein